MVYLHTTRALVLFASCGDSVRKPRATNHLLFLFIYDTLLTPSKY